LRTTCRSPTCSSRASTPQRILVPTRPFAPIPIAWKNTCRRLELRLKDGSSQRCLVPVRVRLRVHGTGSDLPDCGGVVTSCRPFFLHQYCAAARRSSRAATTKSNVCTRVVRLALIADASLLNPECACTISASATTARWRHAPVLGVEGGDAALHGVPLEVAVPASNVPSNKRAGAGWRRLAMQGS
jgi:hypothetical protein